MCTENYGRFLRGLVVIILSPVCVCFYGNCFYSGRILTLEINFIIIYRGGGGCGGSICATTTNCCSRVATMD